ncbi:MAG: type VI secretion system protein TssA [Geminicoccaceae bacterium]
MALPVADLIEPIAEDTPCGEDPALHDGVYQALQQAIQGRVDYKLVGDDEVAVYQPPAWQKIYDDALQCASRTRDLRVCIMLLRGAAGCQGLSGLASGLNLLRQTCAAFWDQLYPPLEEKAATPGDQVFARVAALSELANRQGILRDLQDMPILEARGVGKFGLRAIDLARGKVMPKSGETVVEVGLIEASLAQDPNLSDTLGFIDVARRELEGLISDLNDRLGAEAPDLSPLNKILVDMVDALGGDRTGTDMTAKPLPASDGQDLVSVPESGGAGAGDLRSREQVIAALDRILDYYQRHEPASPIPLLIKRARRLVPMDFLALMEDLAPSSVKQLKELGGVVKAGAGGKEKNTANGDQ